MHRWTCLMGGALAAITVISAQHAQCVEDALNGFPGGYWHQESPGVEGTGEVNDYFGHAVAAGDFNADGYTDLAVGVPGNNASAESVGVVNVLYGSETGIHVVANQAWHQDNDLAGTSELGDRFGHAVVSGDFNGDGYDDVAVGVPYEDISTAENAGAVNIIYGSDAGLTGTGDQMLHQNSANIADSSETGDYFGWALAAADFNRDGYEDLAIGIYGENDSAGAVCVLHGSATGLTGVNSQYWDQNVGAVDSFVEAGDYFGYALAAGDFDGDGYGDLAIGAYGEQYSGQDEAGVVHILYGMADGLMTDVNDYITQGNAAGEVAEAGDWFGKALAAGDFNGDGFDDLTVGAPGQDVDGKSGAGRLHAFFGTSLGVTGANHQMLELVNKQVDENVGHALASADFNADGYDDLAVGIPYHDADKYHDSPYEDAGAVWAVLGTPTGLSTEGSQWFTQINILGSDQLSGGIGSHERLGFSVACGDFNGDFAADLAIGVPSDWPQSFDRIGGVNIAYGVPASLWAPWFPPSASGWLKVSWFGTIQINDEPWIYHYRHGWMFTSGDDLSGLWFFALDMGWLFTGEALYPNLYWFDGGTWIYYLRDSKNPRWFYNYNAGTWQARW